jgi:eukaryotic-like serine/threonine-protein kinase
VSDERRSRIRDLFARLVDLPPEERSRLLDAECAGDPELRLELEDLLGRDALTENLPVTPVIDRLVPSDRVRRIGAYRVIRELGQGGMGEVFLAERDDGQFEHQVALKIVRGGLDRGEIGRRFLHERQILARLRHPNIATLYDGGTTDDGVPYFAMEYVEGLAVTEHCDRLCLDVGARLDLFDAVCRAVQYAHRNLVIHRDLKPSNVLVTAEGIVKLLDFGIAKLLDPQGGEQTLATGGFLTPAYAAPEQVRGDATSTATDVYALGVLLYVLLTGHHPHGDLTRPTDVSRAILERDPPEPSSVAGRDSATLAGDEIARRRGADASTLRRRLRGDLDNIVGRALRKDPDERYASVEDFRADIERHRRSLPVSARPATVRYRIRKFVNRHRVGTAAAAAVALAIVLGVGGIVWQASVAARERDRARAEADRARAVKDYLLEVFSAADPMFESGESLTALELVERGASSVSDRFADDPEIRAEITQVLGTVLSKLAVYGRADTLLTVALAEHRRLDEHERVVETLFELGDVARWQGRLSESVAYFRESLEIARARFGDESLVTARSWGGLGVALGANGEFDEGVKAMMEALRIQRAALGDDHATVAEQLANLATTLIEGGQLKEAEERLRESLGIYQRIEPEGGMGTAEVMASLGEVLERLDRLEESETFLREAVVIFRREYGAEGHPTVAVSLSNLAGTVRAAGRPAEAESLQLEAKEIFTRHLGPDHYFVARIYNNLSVTRNVMGDVEGAVRYLDEAIRLMKRSLGEKHPALFSLMNNRGTYLLDLDRSEEAEAAYRDALSLGRETLGSGNADLAFALVGIGLACQNQRKLAEAEAALREAWALRIEKLGATHSKTVDTRRRLAAIERERGRIADARRTLDGAIEDAHAGLPATRRVLATALLDRTRLGRNAGEDAEALEPLLREALDIRREELGEEDSLTVEIRAELEQVLAAARVR